MNLFSQLLELLGQLLITSSQTHDIHEQRNEECTVRYGQITQSSIGFQTQFSCIFRATCSRRRGVLPQGLSATLPDQLLQSIRIAFLAQAQSQQIGKEQGEG